VKGRRRSGNRDRGWDARIDGVAADSLLMQEKGTVRRFLPILRLFEKTIDTSKRRRVLVVGKLANRCLIAL